MIPGFRKRPSAVIASMKVVQDLDWGLLRKAFFLGSLLPRTRLSRPGYRLVNYIHDQKSQSPTKSSHNAALINIDCILWLDPAIFLLPDIEVPVHSLGRESIEPAGLLAFPNLGLDLRMALHEFLGPVLAKRPSSPLLLKEGCHTGT